MFSKITDTADLSNTLVFANLFTLPLPGIKLIRIFPPLFLIQKLEGLVKLRTVREVPNECVCPPGKRPFQSSLALASADRPSLSRLLRTAEDMFRRMALGFKLSVVPVDHPGVFLPTPSLAGSLLKDSSKSNWLGLIRTVVLGQELSVREDL